MSLTMGEDLLSTVLDHISVFVYVISHRRRVHSEFLLFTIE